MVEYLSYVARLLVYIRDIRPQGQQPQPNNMVPQPNMRPQINRQQPLNSVGAQGTSQQLPLQQVQQPVQRPVGALSQPSMQVPVFFDKSGLTRQQILSQHLQQPQPQPQQPMQQHQLQTPNMLTQPQLGVPPHSQAAHHQMTQPLNVPSNQVGSPMPVQQQPVLPAQQTKHPVPVRMQPVPSPVAPTMTSTSMRAPTPSSAQHSTQTSQAPVAPSPAPIAASPVMHPSPSPQHGVAASPVASSSVPTPGTMNVHSPASVLNPGSVGAPAASPASLNPAEEQAYLDKLQELQPYVEPLSRMITKMNREMRDKEHNNRELRKLKHLHDILTNQSNRVSLQALERSGNVLKNIIKTKPPSVPTPPAPPTPGTTCSTFSSTLAPTVPTTSIDTITHPQAICKPLYDAVSRCAKSPMLSHTLQRTFSPLLQTMEGPPILPLPPPAKKIKLTDIREKKCTVPHVLQGELARLRSRFQVKSGATTGPVHSNTLLHCSIHDLNLPAVPPIEISVPQNYPFSSPECKTANYNANPFLQRVQRQLSSRLQRMPDMYSVTSVLDAWELSIRQACIAEVAVK
ncbi:mediator of RNA polymerase II transcription subunit 15-like isoform X2 [Montipora capricornis]|uniref:mediator of RNA polymerase II transcription subunit 15-like isoform X2 n=1 Tax=Montipora capricornis TaxID=246305 RepID=UPI0035F1FB48